MTIRVVHYINQFFANIGGEEKADHQPEVREGVVGPGLGLQQALGEEAQVVATVICGDGFYGEHTDEARAKCLEFVKAQKPDLFIAGPAFNAGRYGFACGDIAATVGNELGIPAVTAMYHENPGVELYAKKDYPNTYIVPCADSARGMGKALPAMAKLGLKLAKHEPMGPARIEGYIHRGMRKSFFQEKSGAERAVEMLLKKLRGEEFRTEYEMPVFKKIPPAEPIKDLKHATIALVTSGGIVPKGNPDHIEASSATRFGTYCIEGVQSVDAEHYATAHGGYDPSYANADPNRVLPVDVLREMEKEGVFKKLYGYFSTTVGNGTSTANAKKFGLAIGEQLKKDGVDAVILTST